MKKPESFDAVGYMRKERDRMSREMHGMTPQEQVAHIREKSRVSLKEQPTEAEPFLARDKPRDK